VIGMLWAVGVVAEVLMFMAMSRILARFSLRRVLLASFLLAALRWLLLGSLAEFLWLLLFAQVLHAATFGSFTPLPSLSCNVASARASKARARRFTPRWPAPAARWARCIPVTAGTPWARH
jgi:MFS family permease